MTNTTMKTNDDEKGIGSRKTIREVMKTSKKR